MMKVNAFTITFFIILFFGATVGYFIGDWALSATNFIRPGDIIECRVMYPIMGAAGLYVPGVFIADWVERVFD